MTIRAVFFDLDDTLLQTTATRRQRAELVARAVCSSNSRVSENVLVDLILETNAETGWPNGPRTALEKLPLLEDSLRVVDNSAAETDIGLWFFQGCTHLLSSYPSCVETLQKLRDLYLLGVITNGLHSRQNHKFVHLGVADYFQPELFVASEIAGYQKPEPAIFEFALQRGGIAPEEAVHIGDVPEVDVAGAQGAGMRGVWFNPDGKPEPPGVKPDATISSFAELPALLRAWR